MQVQRLFEQVRDRRVLIELPSDFDDRHVEIIVLTIDEPLAASRRPHLDIAGRVKIHGDLLESVLENGWELPG